MCVCDKCQNANCSLLVTDSTCLHLICMKFIKSIACTKERRETFFSGDDDHIIFISISERCTLISMFVCVTGPCRYCVFQRPYG